VIEPLFVIAEYGHGKRAGVLSDYTFAVKDDDNNSVSKLRTIGKEGFAIFSTRYPLFMKERLPFCGYPSSRSRHGLV